MTPAEMALLVGVILGPTGIWGIKELLGRRNAPVKVIDPGPPPPAVVVAPDPQVAALQKKVDAFTGLLGELAVRVDNLERERDAALRDAAHSRGLADQANLQWQVAAGYAVTLRQHINDRKDPPAPDWPPGYRH